MKDYSSLGLSTNLSSDTSLSNEESKFNDAYTFNATGDRNMVSNYELGTISAELITGGTMSANYITAGTLDCTSITVSDSAGSAVIDSSGLNSINSFGAQIATVSGSTTVSFESGTYAPTTNGTITLSRPRQTNYLIGMTVNCRNNAAAGADSALFRFELGGTQIGPDILQAGHNGTTSTVTNQSASGQFVYTAATGTSDLVLMFATSGAGTTIINSLNINQLYAIKLGK